MRLTTHTLLLSLALSALTLAAGCLADEPTPRADVAPGQGITVGNQLISLGDGAVTLTEGLGEPTRNRDLGVVGVRFWYDDHGVSGLLSGSGDDATVLAIYGNQGFVGQTAEGIGIGSSAAEVEATFGTPEVDTFAGHLWYREQGIAFHVVDATVESVHLFAAGAAAP